MFLLLLVAFSIAFFATVFTIFARIDKVNRLQTKSSLSTFSSKLPITAATKAKSKYNLLEDGNKIKRIDVWIEKDEMCEKYSKLLLSRLESDYCERIFCHLLDDTEMDLCHQQLVILVINELEPSNVKLVPVKGQCCYFYILNGLADAALMDRWIHYMTFHKLASLSKSNGSLVKLLETLQPPPLSLSSSPPLSPIDSFINCDQITLN